MGGFCGAGRGFACPKAGGERPPAFFVLALGTSYGALDELHQSLVPGRSAELGDWLADAVGVALGSFAFSRYE